jgi:hypothetical protein
LIVFIKSGLIVRIQNLFCFGSPRCDVVFAPKYDPLPLNNAQTIPSFDYSQVLVDINPEFDQELLRSSSWHPNVSGMFIY